MRSPIKHFWRELLIVVLVVASLRTVNAAASNRAVTAGIRASTITMPDGSRQMLQTAADLHVSLYASGLASARFMALGPQGDIFVGSWSAGTVSVLLNRKAGTQATQVVTLLQGFTVPHSVAYHNGLLYVAEEGQVTSWRYNPGTVSLSNRTVVIASLPTGGRHLSRTLSVGPDGSLYVSIGSSCDACADAPRRAVIMQYRADGSGGEVYASGLRNAVGLAWQPGSGRLWSGDNGQDDLGDNTPPDEVDLIQRGGNYGWPYCWGNGQNDPTVAPAAGYCARTIRPAVSLQAHSAPLGLTFYSAKQLPARYRGGLFVAYHGSWARSQATGFKVVFIPVSGTHAGAPQDFVTGWLAAGASSSGAAWGRPVGVLVAADGSLLISDDQAGVVYRVAA